LPRPSSTDVAGVDLDIALGQVAGPDRPAAGAEAQIDLLELQKKRLRLIGSVLRSRSDEEKTAIIAAFKERFWPLLIDGRMRAVIEDVLPIERAAEAQDILRQNRNIGKVVLQVRP